MNSLVLSRIIGMTAAMSSLSLGDIEAAKAISKDLEKLLAVIGFDNEVVMRDASVFCAQVAAGQADWLEFYRREYAAATGG